MPVYEYRCGACRRRSSKLFRTFAEIATPACPHCGAAPEQMQKLISRVSVMKSEEARLEALADPSMFADVDENDPRSVARWARKLGETMGDDVPDDYGEMVEQLESGEMPDDIGGAEDGAADVGSLD
ncbi:MAG TPA: zinc ribbon domain-containing protein [Chloroflexota bacterium]|nr:zinc ribbon domain-containing protein [Chloroflexota bacterium]